MKVSRQIVAKRREELAHFVHRKRFVPIQEVCQRFGVSEATVRRDLKALEKEDLIVRTHGGAMGDYDATFVSFQERLEINAEAKRRIARVARSYIASGMTIFLDAGTTLWYVARELIEQPVASLKVVTNNFALAELLGPSTGMKVVIVGGEFLNRQSVLLGEVAHRGLQQFQFDLAFLGAVGFDHDGFWNNQPDVAQFQTNVLERSRRRIFCVDESKLGHRGSDFVANWEATDHVLTNASKAAVLQRLAVRSVEPIVSVP